MEHNSISTLAQKLILILQNNEFVSKVLNSIPFKNLTQKLDVQTDKQGKIVALWLFNVMILKSVRLWSCAAYVSIQFEEHSTFLFWWPLHINYHQHAPL